MPFYRAVILSSPPWNLEFCSLFGWFEFEPRLQFTALNMICLFILLLLILFWWRQRRDDVVTTTSCRRRRDDDDVVTTSSRRNYLENGFIAISQPEIMRLNEIWCADADWFQGRLLHKIVKFCKFKMADGRHIENRLLAAILNMVLSL